MVLLEPGFTSAPSGIPVLTQAPTGTPTTQSPTTTPITKAPVMSPVKSPTSSLSDLIARIFRYTLPPIQAPTSAPSSNNDDFFSLLNPPSKSRPRSTRQPTQVPIVAPTANNIDFISLLNPTTQNDTESLSGKLDTSTVVEPSSLYAAGYVVDEVGKDLIIQLGRSVGICSTCGSSGSLRAGLRAEIRGIVTEISTSFGPHKLAVSSLQLSNNLTSICQSSLESPTRINDNTTMSPSPSYLRTPYDVGLFSRVRKAFNSFLDIFV